LPHGGDLDVIVLKALAREPDNRYESARALREDLERYLQNRPIKARPAPLSYRVKKLAVRHRTLISVTGVLMAALLALVGHELEHRVAETPALTAPPFHPPPHAIAVLPFVNLSADKGQDYFSDGLSEELLNSLSRITELQVAAQTSSFSFKGQHADLSTIAHELNVATVLEGSVRRSGHTMRISADLSDAVTGFHLWSQTFDYRDRGDPLKLQTEIANAVVRALKVKLLGDVAGKIDLGGTHNPSAFDAYLRGSQGARAYHDGKDLQAAIAAFTEATNLDSSYALAFAGRSLAVNAYTSQFSTRDRKRGFDNAEADARRAILLAPELAEAHMALGLFFENGLFDFEQASEEYERAMALAPGNALVLRNYGMSMAEIGRSQRGIEAARRAVVLDPLGRSSRTALGYVLYAARRYKEAIAVFDEVLSLDPGFTYAAAMRGRAYYMLGEFERARASCDIEHPDYTVRVCSAITLEKLGGHQDAAAQLRSLMQLGGDDAAYQYAEIYAQWGRTSKALDWLETALRLGDPGLSALASDPLLDPIRKEPRYQAIKRKLKLPPGGVNHA
jgi:TolB-like protein/Tfp pilus assembly protein PilF